MYFYCYAFPNRYLASGVSTSVRTDTREAVPQGPDWHLAGRGTKASQPRRTSARKFDLALGIGLEQRASYGREYFDEHPIGAVVPVVEGEKEGPVGEDDLRWGGGGGGG